MWDLGKEWRETSIFDGVNLADVNCYKKGSEEKEAVFDLFFREGHRAKEVGRLAGNSESDLFKFLKKFAKLDAGKSDSILVGSLKDHKTWGKETFSRS